jgi:uncharacterized membrane protein YkvA (DUF1232 family)
MSNIPISPADLENERIGLPMVIARNEETVRESFWPKLMKVMANIPFAEEAVAAYYCALDSETPLRVKGILLAALAYFIMPVDVIPDFLLGLGFTDDLTVLVTAISLIRSHMRPEHRDRAQAALQRLRQGARPAF